MTVTTSELVHSPDTILEFHGHLNGQREATRCRLLTGKSRLPSSLLGPGVRSEISESPRPTVALIEIQIIDSSLPSVFHLQRSNGTAKNGVRTPSTSDRRRSDPLMNAVNWTNWAVHTSAPTHKQATINSRFACRTIRLHCPIRLIRGIRHSVTIWPGGRANCTRRGNTDEQPDCSIRTTSTSDT